LGVDIGDTVLVYKSGEIIPKIKAVVHKSSAGSFHIGSLCPVCGSRAVREENTADIKCQNPNCPAQRESHILNFVSRNAMDIKGFGDKYIAALLAGGFLDDIAGIYRLAEQREELIAQGIIGKEKNTDKLLAAIEASKKNEPQRLLTGLGIPNIGAAAARELMAAFGSVDALAGASLEAIEAVPDMGEISAKALVDFFADGKNQQMLAALRAAGVNMERHDSGNQDAIFQDKVFVITGTLPTMGRQEAQSFIESHGGRVSGSVSKKTDYLVAGEAAGSKLRKAQELGTTVIDEEGLQALAAK
jgi:DNA ligase (NAD+)